MDATYEVSNVRMEEDAFHRERKSVLSSWPTGAGVRLEEGIDYQKNLPRHKVFAYRLRKAREEHRVLLQPRAGVALVDEHISLLRYLQEESDLLPTTIDAYTRQNKYESAAAGIEKSRKAGYSLLNGFPAVNHGVSLCRKVVESLDKPVEIRHGTPDARLLAEITLCAGFTSFEGGAVSYNIPYAKKVGLDRSIRDWQYVDRLVGMYEENGVVINREPFGPLSGTLVPPFISHTIAVIEGMLALRQGVKSVSLGYGQLGNIVQDVAAIVTLRELADELFKEMGYSDYELTTVFHQWMGGFPEDEAKAFAVIGWGGCCAAFSRATKVIVKTPHEAYGVPTKEANLSGLKTTKQIINMLADQEFPDSQTLRNEIEMIKKEAKHLFYAVLKQGDGDIARGVVRGFESGVLDVPFSPSQFNQGKLLPIRDNTGAIRVFDWGNVPSESEAAEYHREKIEERAAYEHRKPCFQMVIDDIYAISKGRLVGRPR